MLKTMMTGTMPGVADSAEEDKVKKRRMTSARSMDESSQGPKRAVAEDVACPLRIQPSVHSIHSTEDSSFKRPVASTMQL
jgi:hypothetical protein